MVVTWGSVCTKERRCYRGRWAVGAVHH